MTTPALGMVDKMSTAVTEGSTQPDRKVRSVAAKKGAGVAAEMGRLKAKRADLHNSRVPRSGPVGTQPGGVK